jgi:ATP-dependent exoDNAse (exonuclease V) alpha subunit
MKSISRASGRGAPGAAAYRAGERIRDERTGQLHDYSGRGDVSHAEIILPGALEASAPEWLKERAALWNGAEAVERRYDSRVAREYEVSLPVELAAEQRLELARAFSRELADRYRVAVDLTMHDPPPAGDHRNFHAHLLTTTREVTATGLGSKAEPEWRGSRRLQQGLPSSRAELTAVRERWAVLTNAAFRAAGLDLRIDHRSLAAQGIDREPIPNIPYAAVQMERRGMRSEVAERIREEYRARVLSRRELAAAARETGSDIGSHAASPPRVGLEEMQRLAREAWLEIRRNARLGLDSSQNEVPGSSVSRDADLDKSQSVDVARHRARDRDFSL